MSIIISETVDAADYYDGFGTGEIVIGIRAYQWGWEYFYPKNIDLSYNVKPSYSSFIGNSIKYNNINEKSLNSNNLWKYYQIKQNTDQVNTPGHLLLSPTDNNLILNNIDFSNVGNSISKDTEAFKKIQKYSKIVNNNISQDLLNNNLRFEKINNLYLNVNSLNNNSFNYGTYRQHNFTSLNSTLPSYSSLIDKNALDKFFDYSLNTNIKNSKLLNNIIVPYKVNYNLNKEEQVSTNKQTRSLLNKFNRNDFFSK
jgi:hypothetical protein